MVSEIEKLSGHRFEIQQLYPKNIYGSEMNSKKGMLNVHMYGSEIPTYEEE